jgi:hypothetical protein
MCVQRLELLRLAQLGGDLISDRPERVLAFGEQLDEARPALEELGELIDRQLPR